MHSSLSSQRIARVASFALPALALLYLAAPGHPLGLLRGIPLDTWGLAAFGTVAIAWFGFGRPAPGRITTVLCGVVCALIAVKVVLWTAAPSYGLAASYYARARFGGEPERSTEHRGNAFTRIDRALDGNLALHFFNDVERFNFLEEGDPDRATLPFAVRWVGFLAVPLDREYQIALTASGSAALFVDDRPLLTVPAGSIRATDAASVSLARGVVPIRVEYIHAGGTPPELKVEWDSGHGLEPLGGMNSMPVHFEHSHFERASESGRIATAVDVGLFAILIGLAVLGLARLLRSQPSRPALERPALAVLLFAVLAYALATTRGLAGRAVILESGQDWLTYESYARDILLNGPLMTLGEPLGKGKPYFFQPFYPYYLAALHWVAGEALWGPIVLQLVGSGVAGVLIFFLSKRLADARSAWLALALYALLFWTQLDWVARKLLSENLYFILVPAALICLLRFVDARRARDLALAGLLFGIASITRAPTMLYLGVAAPLLVLLLRRQGVAMRGAVAAAAVLLLLTGLVASLVPLRNYVVSGQPALVATNGGATLLLAHTPTDRVRLAGIDRDPVYNLLRLGRQTREVVEFVRQDPVGYVATLVPLGLYTVGFSGAVEGAPQVTWEILGLTVLYGLSLAVVPWAWTLRAGLLHAFIGVHVLIMVTFLPYVYGYRQVLPMNLLMLPFAGGLLAQVARDRLAIPRSASGDRRLAQQRAD
jgi:hypothetical protein